MMARLAALFRWLGTPICATRALFPFTYDGRQTLIYLMCALSAPVLTTAVLALADVAADHGQWPEHRELSRLMGYSLLITSCAFSMFVAFRSLSLGGKDGLLNLSSKDNPDPVKAAEAVKTEVNKAAQETVDRVVEATVTGQPLSKPDDPAIPDYAKP